MVRILRAYRELLHKIQGEVIDMDGLYSFYYDDAVELFELEPRECIIKLFEIIQSMSNVVIFSYDTLMFLLIEISGRKGYKSQLNNLLRAMRILECATGKSITLIRYVEKMKNDPEDLSQANSPCPV